MIELEIVPSSTKKAATLIREAGQAFIIGFDGTEMSPGLRSLLTGLQPAGVILFARNIVSAKQTHQLLKDCQACVAVPLFTCVDMEGGKVDRFRKLNGGSPSAADVFATGDRKLFREHGRVIGNSCRGLGFNTDFAPVLDLAFDASRNVMSSRAVSADPRQTAIYAGEFLLGLREAGVLGCGKHFPGLGEGNLDSHLDLPVINKPLKIMWAEDILPYRLLRRKLPFVLISHAGYPGLSGDNTPASLSRKIIGDILRKRVGYTGLVVSDDLEMGAIIKTVTIEQAAVQHLAAGGDLCLICHSEDLVLRGYEAVVHEAECNRRFASQLAATVKRVERLKSKLLKSVDWKFPPAPTPHKTEQMSRRVRQFNDTVRSKTRGRGELMIVAGVMSGTSCDGIDVALVDILGKGPRFKLLAHAQYPYPKKVRQAILAAMNSNCAVVADLARLNFLLGELYAEAILTTQRRFKTKIQLAGCHGQTLYHQGDSAMFLNRKLAVTWQTGDGSVIAARIGVPVVSDFRPADMAAGGMGAPLVPFFDYVLFRDRRIGRIVQNIGGIANLTAIPAGASPKDVRAFDTGPGNMVIDALAFSLFGKPYDKDGKIAASGKVLEDVLGAVLRQGYFRKMPPKTAGREEFGSEFARIFLQKCGRADKRDILATATALTAYSIADAIKRFVLKNAPYKEIVVSGGGTRNPTLLAMLASRMAPMGLKLRLSDEFGIPSEAKEAAAFALLAYQTWNRRPSNIPSATGAKRAAILGKISYV